MKFVAIDFETANSERSSACEIGLAVVNDFKIVDKISYLIKPKDNYFNHYNSVIHGINEDMVKNEPEFDKIFEKIRPILESYPIIAHNASFDISVLRRTLDLYGLDYPEIKYSCTYQMAKQHLSDQFSYKLNSICDYYDIELDHHRALSDSVACAKIAIRFFKEREIHEFDQIAEKFQLRIGKLFKGGYSSSSTRGLKSGYKISDLKFDSGNYQSENPFFEKNVVFTGTLQSLVRKEAQVLVLEIGGKCSSGINSETNYLIIGDQDYSKYGEGFKSSKIKKAEKYLSKGQQIELLSESQFLEMMDNE